MALRDMKEKISGVRAATHIGVQLTVEMMEVCQLTLVSPWSSSSPSSSSSSAGYKSQTEVQQVHESVILEEGRRASK